MGPGEPRRHVLSASLRVLCAISVSGADEPYANACCAVSCVLAWLRERTRTAMLRTAAPGPAIVTGVFSIFFVKQRWHILGTGAHVAAAPHTHGGPNPNKCIHTHDLAVRSRSPDQNFKMISTSLFGIPFENSSDLSSGRRPWGGAALGGSVVQLQPQCERNVFQ